MSDEESEEIKSCFIAVRKSCEEGLSGEWDASGEGAESFEPMIELLDRIDKFYNITRGADE